MQEILATLADAAGCEFGSARSQQAEAK